MKSLSEGYCDERLPLICPIVEKSVGGLVATCFPSGCEEQSYIEPHFNLDQLFSQLQPWGPAFYITASVCVCAVDMKHI